MTRRILQPVTVLRKSLPLIFIGLFFSQASYPADRNDDVDEVITFLFENDMFALDDGGYTNGLAYGWGYGTFDSFENRTPEWMQWLVGDWYIENLPDKERAISYGIAQQIYTPDKTSTKVPDPNDRPYAGLLLWQTSWFAFDTFIADKITLQLGMVGPASLAEHGQKFVHNITGASSPKGWGRQLENEPVFRLATQRNWRLQRNHIKNLEVDMVSHWYAGAGNLRSDTGTGITLRLGRGLDETLAIVSMTPNQDINPLAGRTSKWYTFISLGGRYVLNDITLDGNTFKNGPSVDLEHWQTMASAGIAWNTGNWGWLFSMYRGGDEWQTQQEDTAYGALSLSYRFSAEGTNPQ